MGKWRWDRVGRGEWRVTDTEAEARERDEMRAAWELFRNRMLSPAAIEACNQQAQALESYYAKMQNDARLWNRYASAVRGNPIGPFLPRL